MKILMRSFFLASLLGCLMALGSPNVSAAPIPKTVLVLSPFQFDLAANLITAQALREEFGNATDLGLDVYYEYLDLNRFPDAAYQQQIFDLLSAKYKNKSVDLVMIGSETMLKLWLAQRAGILPNTPIVFFDVFTEHLEALNLPDHVTGVSGVEDCEKSVRWVLGAMPAVNEIVLASGAGMIDQGFFDHIQKLQAALKGQVKFTDLAGLPLAEIKSRVAKLPKTSIVLYHPMFEDAAGTKYRPLDVLRELTTASTVPVIGGYDQFIGTGIIGGYMYSIDQQARDAAQIGLRVLRGAAPNSIPIERNESDRFIFDHLALQRFDIPLSRVPSDSLIKNRQYSLWELYQPQIIATSTGVVGLLLLVIFLLGVTRQLNQTRLALTHSNAHLETQVQERTRALSQTNLLLHSIMASPQGVVIFALDPNFCYTAFTVTHQATMRAIWGVEISIGMNMLDAIRDPIDCAKARQNFERALRGEHFILTEEYGDPSKYRTYYEDRYSPIKNDTGDIVGVTVFVIDITERKQTEEQLRASEEKFRNLLDSQTSNIMVLDFEGVHHYVNPVAIVSMTGSGTAQDILGKRLHDFYPARVADWQLEQIQQVITTGQGISGDFENKTDDQSRWWHLNLEPIRNASGQVTQVMVNSLDITERKHAEQVLRESEERFHALADTAPVLIWMSGTDTLCNYFNQPWLNFTGRTMEQELGNRWAEGVHPDDLQRCLDIYLQAFHARQTFSMEYRLRRADDEYRWVVDNGVPRFLPDGTFVGYIGSCLDITERKQIEEHLRESEARTAAIVRLSPIVIGVSTVAEGRYTDVNDAFELMLGYSRAETIGRTSFELNLWVEDNTRARILHEIQTHGRVENHEIHLRRKSGEVFSALMFVTPIVLHDTPCLLFMIMDITERKRVEEQLRETHDALQAIIYASPLAILTLDVQDHVTTWNPAAEEMFGWSNKQILGQSNPTVPEAKSNEYVVLGQAAMNGMAFSNIETVRQKKDGSSFPVSLSVAPLRGNQGQVVGRMHIIADITDRKRLQEELRQQATTDELTGVFNRRYFLQAAQGELKRAIRLNRPIALALIDLDHFKQINDTYGHAAGDQVIKAFAKICQKNVRDIDVFARFGGDEFIVLLPETSGEQARDVVERVRVALNAHPIDLGDQSVSLTLSSGIGSLAAHDADASVDALLGRADYALYRAKEAGRNQVSIAHKDEE